MDFFSGVQAAHRKAGEPFGRPLTHLAAFRLKKAGQVLAGWTVDQDELLAKMRARVDLCRNLAASTTDPRAARVLNDIADEGEADMTVRRSSGSIA
jgi:hypothetical protein